MDKTTAARKIQTAVRAAGLQQGASVQVSKNEPGYCPCFHCPLCWQIACGCRRTFRVVHAVATGPVRQRLRSNSVGHEVAARLRGLLQVQTFGSFANGLGMHSSDLDLVVTGLLAPDHPRNGGT